MASMFENSLSLLSESVTRIFATEYSLTLDDSVLAINAEYVRKIRNPDNLGWIDLTYGALKVHDQTVAEQWIGAGVNVQGVDYRVASITHNESTSILKLSPFIETSSQSSNPYGV